VVTTLTEKQLAVLRHIQTFRMTTPPVVKALFFPDEGPDAVKSFLRRLREAGLIDSAPLFEKYRYYHLAKPAASFLGEDPRKCSHLPPSSLLDHYGMLLFCCSQKPFRKRYPESEFRAEHPQLAVPGLLHRNYYIDRNEEEARLAQASDSS